MLTETARLRKAMAECVPEEFYPPGVVPVRAFIEGTAFFPGGSGLYMESRDPEDLKFPTCGVMVLGHNFDSEVGFEASLARGKERLTIGTWGSLLKLLGDAKIPLAECFFTNAFMGLCAGADNLKYPGRSRAFLSACLAFLQQQIAMQQPRLIVSLGRFVPPMLAMLSPDLSHWRGHETPLEVLDANPIKGASLQVGSESVPTVVVPIAHPSYPNNRKRNPRGFSPGRQGEVEAMREGWRIATQG